MVDRKRPRTNVSWIVPLFLGLSEFSSIAQKPRLEMYRTVDVVGLLVSGGCFILALGLGHLASGSTSHCGARRGHPAGARSHPRGYNGNVGGDERRPTPAMTVDRAKLLQLREQLDVLLPSANRR